MPPSSPKAVSAPRSARTHRPAKVEDAIRAGHYVTEGSTKSQRAAHFFDWAATHYPKQAIDWDNVHRAIHGYTGRVPAIEVELLKRSASIRQALRARYHRELVSIPGVGARATVSADDLLQHVLPKKADRVRAAKHAFVTTYELIDPKQLTSSPEMAPYKRWFERSLPDVMRTIGSPEFEQRLFLAPPDRTK